MKRIKLDYCDKDEGLWEEYFLFLMDHYEKLGLPYEFEMTLSFVGSPMLEGNALIASERTTETIIGILGFVFGVGAEQFEDKTVCQVEIIYIDKLWRHTRLFLSMLYSFASYLKHYHPQVERIQFWLPTDRLDLSRLFGKFSTKIKTNEKSFGRISLYHTDAMQILTTCSKYWERRSVKDEILFP